MHRVKIFLKTLSPVVLTSESNTTVMTGTHTAFGGSILRGIFASRFVKEQKLQDEAHDEIFRELFFGGLKFLPANPEIFGERSFILPLSLQSGKAGSSVGNEVKDLLSSDKKSLRGYKSFRGFGVKRDKKIFQSQIKTNMFMHMSRSNENERLSGKSEDSGIYNYEAIDAGQNFCGEIIGDKKLLLKLRDGLNLDGGKMIAYVGRSKFTQYGKCLLTFGEVEELPETNFGEKIFLRLDTPLIPVDENFLSAETVLTTEIADKLGEKFSIGEIFASYVEIENFVVPWSMKRPRVSALAAGSVFALNFSSTLTDDEKNSLREKIFAGFGTRTEEGFGQLRLWQPLENFVKGKHGEKISKPETFSAETISRAKKILTAHISERIRLFAYEDAKKLETLLRRGNFTHFFTRLSRILSSAGKENVRQNFKLRLEQEIRKGSPFEDHLNNFCTANGKKFIDVFTGTADFPRNVHELMKISAIAAVKDVIDFTDKDFSDDEFFAEYLTNYFRFARKLAAGGDGRE